MHDEASDPDFVKASTVVLRDLADNVLKPSEELGKPFVQMVDELADSGKKTMKFKSGETEYVAAEAVIAKTGYALRELHFRIQFGFEAIAAAQQGYSLSRAATAASAKFL